MKKTYLLSLIALFSFSFSYAQSFEWAKSVGGTSTDIGFSSAIDNSGNIYTTGFFNDTVDFDPGSGVYNLSSNGGQDIFIQKLDPLGNLVWAKSFGGTSYEEAMSIAIDKSGNVYTTGKFNGTVDFDPGSGTYNLTSIGSSSGTIFIQKLTSNGDFLWAIAMGGSTSYNEGFSMIFDSQGNVYTTGYFSATADFDPGSGTYNLSSNGGQDIFIQKLDTMGSFMWAKSIGGTSSDYGESIDVDNSGNICITGSFNGTVDFDPGSGTFNLTASSDDIFIQKLDHNGNFIWAKAMGGTNQDKGHSISIDNSGNIYTSGLFNGTADFDPGSGTYNLTSNGMADIFIQKIDANGDFLWAKAMGANYYDESKSITIDNLGGVYSTGYYFGPADFDPGSGTYNLTHSGNAMYIQKLDSNGNFMWAKSMEGTAAVNGFSILVDDLGNIYTSGNYEGTIDFDPGSGVYNLTSNGGKDIFVSKLKLMSVTSFTASQTSFTSPPFNITFTNTSIGYHSYTWNFGDGNVSSLENPTHTYQYNGNYQVMLLATDTISNVSDTAILSITCTGGTDNPCGFNAELTQAKSAEIICVGDSFRLSANSMANITYAWTFNGAVVPGAIDSIFYAKQQGFYMAVLSNATCSRTTSNYFVLANHPHTTPVVTTVGSISPCSDDSLKLEAPSGFASYQWSNGKTGASIFVNSSGYYYVDAIDNNTCSNISQETIINVALADIPNICAVSVNANSNHNIVKWQAQSTQKIDSFRVYRESNIINKYDLIGSVAYSDPYEVEDVNSNVAVRQYAYRITAIDTCGKETPFSIEHKTMHLQINVAINNHWNLIWRPYEGFSFGTYKIYRGIDSTNMTLLATVPSTVTSYTDLSNPSGDIYYQIEVVSNSPCGAKSFGISRSNNFNTKNASGLGIKSASIDGLSMMLFPNPNKGSFTLEVNSATNKPQTYQLEIYSAMGALIYSEKLNMTTSLSKQMHLEYLSKGIYFIHLKSKDNVLKARFIVL